MVPPSAPMFRIIREKGKQKAEWRFGADNGKNRRNVAILSLVIFFQRCQMTFFKSARSNVKIRQNPPSRICQIRQKSARNWDDFRPFFTLREVFMVFLCGFCLISEVAQGGIFLIFFENIFSFLKIFCTTIFVLNYFLYGRKSEKKVVFLVKETPNPPEIRQKLGFRQK
jgi:hypothetical protein